MKLIALGLYAASVVTLAGCTHTPPTAAIKPDLARSARGIIGTGIIGTKGLTPKDQDNIDDLVAGACAVKVFTENECRRHEGS